MDGKETERDDSVDYYVSDSGTAFYAARDRYFIFRPWKDSSGSPWEFLVPGSPTWDAQRPL